MYCREILKLVYLLQEAKVPYEIKECWDGWQIIVRGVGDAVCHNFSYGSEMGFLEIMGGLTEEEESMNSVLGWLDAKEVVKRFIWCWKNNSRIYLKKKALDEYDSIFDAAIDREKGLG